MLDDMSQVVNRQVKAVEQKLQIESSYYEYSDNVYYYVYVDDDGNVSEQINYTLTNADLQTAAEMFLYLNTCPKTIEPWFEFYKICSKPSH